MMPLLSSQGRSSPHSRPSRDRQKGATGKAVTDHEAKHSPRPAARVSQPAVLGAGLVTLDVVLSASAARPPVFRAGGTCGNVLSILSYLGWEAFPIARLGSDAASAIVRADLARWNVSLEFSAKAPKAATPIIVHTIHQNRNGIPIHRFALSCPLCGSWFPTFRPVTIEAADEVVEAVDGSAPDGFAPRVFFFDRVSRGTLTLARALAGHGALVVFEPSSVGDSKLFAEAIAVAHVLKYSHERLPRLADKIPFNSQRLLEIETCGSDGLRYRSRLLSSLRWHSLDAVRAPVVADTAGAGDWCTAGLLYALANDGIEGLENAHAADLADAIRFGQAAAAVACGFEGARGAMYELSRQAFGSSVNLLLNRGSPTRAKAPKQPNHSPPRARRLSSRRARAVSVGRVCPACP
jgi:sugar/nucleoside kinase (ribokinase family)